MLQVFCHFTVSFPRPEIINRALQAFCRVFARRASALAGTRAAFIMTRDACTWHILCVFRPHRGFVRSAHERRPLHHQRSGDINAWRDAYLTTELWVIKDNPPPLFTHKRNKQLVLSYFCGEFFFLKCNLTFPPLGITQKYFPRRDLLQLHKCAQWQHPSC